MHKNTGFQAWSTSKWANPSVANSPDPIISIAILYKMGNHKILNRQIIYSDSLTLNGISITVRIHISMVTCA